MQFQDLGSRGKLVETQKYEEENVKGKALSKHWTKINVPKD